MKDDQRTSDHGRQEEDQAEGKAVSWPPNWVWLMVFLGPPLVLLIFWEFSVHAFAGPGFSTEALWAMRGQFGDQFGAVNALFSGWAFAGMVLAIFLQRKELSLQRDELGLQRAELKLQREEMEKSSDALEQQVAEMQRATRLAATPIVVGDVDLHILCYDGGAPRSVSSGDPEVGEGPFACRLIFAWRNTTPFPAVNLAGKIMLDQKVVARIDKYMLAANSVTPHAFAWVRFVNSAYIRALLVGDATPMRCELTYRNVLGARFLVEQEIHLKPKASEMEIAERVVGLIEAAERDEDKERLRSLVKNPQSKLRTHTSADGFNIKVVEACSPRER